MKITRHPESYNIERAFPEAREIHTAEGARVYSAEYNSQCFLIIDSRTTLDFFDGEERKDLASEIVAVYEFESEEERTAHLNSKGIMPNGANQED